MKGLSSLLQFIIGFILGVVVLAGGTAALGFVFFSRMASTPPKPVFPEERAKPKPKKAIAKKPQVKSTPEKSPSPSPSPEEKEDKEKLPPGAYKARVTWSEGLSLRDQPSFDGTRVSGVMYNDEVIVLETSSDGGWQKVRVAGGTQEGWVKGGNLKKEE